MVDSLPIIKADQYGYLPLDVKTAHDVAKWLLHHGSVAITLSDDGTHYDVVLSRAKKVEQKPELQFQRGFNPYSDLVISIIGAGSFGFSLLARPNTHPKYYSEKLGTDITQNIADFFNYLRCGILNVMRNMD